MRPGLHPQGKMKFCTIFITVLVVRQVELNKHRHHHHTDQEEVLNTVGPKPGIYRNKLVAEYGTNFRYLGKVKNGLDRVTVVKNIALYRVPATKRKILCRKGA